MTYTHGHDDGIFIKISVVLEVAYTETENVLTNTKQINYTRTAFKPA